MCSWTVIDEISPTSTSINICNITETLRAELVGDGIPAAQIRLRPLLLREGLLPQFPVVRGGCAEKASADALAESVQSILRGTDVSPFEGLRRLVTEGTAANTAGMHVRLMRVRESSKFLREA